MSLPPALNCPSPRVQWPVGAATVTVWTRRNKDGGPTYETGIDDPAIQDFEVMATWDAVFHVPKRLRLDYGDAEPEAWHGMAWHVIPSLSDQN
jgi:hypothetical protein